MNAALKTLLLPYDLGELAPPREALFLRCERHPALSDWPSVIGWQPLLPAAAEWDSVGLSRVTNLSDIEKRELVLLLPAKDRDETLFLMAMAFDSMTADGRLVMALPNNGGAPRYQKELAAAGCTVNHLSKHKCRVIWTDKGSRPSVNTLLGWRQLGLQRPITATPFVAQSGIYGSQKIDAGSMLLARHFPTRLRGKVADLGAGWGYLAHELAQKCRGVRSIDLFEADARALDCARQNLATIPCELSYHWHDVTTGVGEGSYDAVVMNPPFHTGLATDVGLGRAFISTAAQALKTRGELWMVANSHLPYETTLDEQGLSWKIIDQTPAFKVIAARKLAL